MLQLYQSRKLYSAMGSDPDSALSAIVALVRFRSFQSSSYQGCLPFGQKSGNFGLNSNGKVIFRKFRSEIVEYLQRYSSFSVRNGTAEISLPFAKVSSFQSLISRKQLLRFPIERGARQVSRPSFTVETPMLSLVTALVSIGNILRY